ncbi:hypothetical protein [Streptomyces sp. NPDC055094]
MDTLHKARQARNWIAHEGASIGDIWSVDRDGILQQAVELRTAVTDLALGDNIISQWECFPSTTRQRVRRWRKVGSLESLWGE